MTDKESQDKGGPDIAVLEKSFALIAPQAERLVERFYAELFRRHPAVRPMFGNTDMRAQRSKLIAALQLVVANVRKPQKLIPALQEMGRRHEKYGAQPEHYQAVARTLLDVMSEIAGPNWTPQVKQAWSEALGHIGETMLGAYRGQAGRNNETREESQMNIFSKLSLRWKLAVALLPAVATLLYFAWTANPAIALGAVAATLLLGVFVKDAVHTPASNEQQSADFAGQIEAIGKAQAVIEFNMDGTIITANDNFLGAVGYSLGEVQGQHHSMFVEPEYKASAEYREFWEKLNRGEYEAAEYKRLGKDGKEVWIQASYNPIMDLNGKPFKVVKFATDVTAQKLSNADFAGQLDAIAKAQAVIEFNMDGTIITANDNFLNTLGYTLDEIQGKHHGMFAEPEYAASAEYKQFWEKLNRGEYEAAEYKRLGKDGKEVWIQASYNPIMDLNGKPFKVVKFATDVTAQKLQNVENGIISKALEKLTANVMVADVNLDIMYMNETVGEMFRTAESDIQKDLPRFRASKLMGTCIDDFHKDPSHQRRMLADLNETFESQLELGGRTFQIIANPLVGGNGERIGTVVEWQDLTASLAREEKERRRLDAERILGAENGRIKQALDGVTGNVMIGDTDLNIVYMNEAVTKLFNEAEADIRKDLPNFSAGQMMGTCIDLFHRNPAHQRRMLADLNSTHTAELELGGRTMKVVASPVFDDEGERLGTVVEWADRTQELAVEKEVQHIVDSALAGDLTSRISLEDKKAFFEKLSDAINQLVGVQMDVVGKIKVAAGSVKTGADEISQGNTNLSQRTEEQASSLEETASSMEEMTSTVKQNADNAGEANQLAMAAREQAEKGGRVVSEAVEAMNEINESSKKISDIIGVIDEIAFQTNLLALNASVEAARAGDQGRGFAVVATEVRNLAGRSATAAKEIKDLIEDSADKVNEGSRLVNESGETLEEIVNGVKKVTDIVGEIAAASQEQSAGIEQVNKAIVQLDELTQQNAALVEEASAASQSMGDQADDLNQMMANFTVDHNGQGNAPASDDALPGGVERRSVNRPWTGPETAKESAQVAAPAPKRKAAAVGGDSEWEEF